MFTHLKYLYNQLNDIKILENKKRRELSNEESSILGRNAKFKSGDRVLVLDDHHYNGKIFTIKEPFIYTDLERHAFIIRSVGIRYSVVEVPDFWPTEDKIELSKEMEEK